MAELLAWGSQKTISPGGEPRARRPDLDEDSKMGSGSRLIKLLIVNVNTCRHPVKATVGSLVLTFLFSLATADKVRKNSTSLNGSEGTKLLEQV